MKQEKEREGGGVDIVIRWEEEKKESKSIGDKESAGRWMERGRQ